MIVSADEYNNLLGNVIRVVEVSRDGERYTDFYLKARLFSKIYCLFQNCNGLESGGKGIIMLHRNIGIQDGFYGTFSYDRNKKKVFEEMGKEAYVTAIVDVWDKDECYLDITFCGYNGEKTITIPRSDLNTKGLLKYAQQGLDVFDHTVLTLIKLFQKQEEENLYYNNIFFEHHGLGWSNYGDEKIFRGYTVEKEFLRSDYRGDFDIEPCGSFDVWRDMIKRLVVGNTPLEFALAVGFSAALVKPLEDLIDGESIFVHLMGASSTGKTTAANLIASIGGAPDVHSNGLMQTWNFTENAAIRYLVGNNGFPIIFDEVSMQKRKDLSSFTYIVASGCEKRRLNDKTNKTQKFQTTIISTGESSILNQTNGNTGLKMRLIEVGDVAFTPNAKVSEEIKKICSANYGWAITPFAEHVSSLGYDYLRKGWEYYYSKLTKDLSSDDKYVARLSKKLSVILLAAHIVKKKFDINLNMDKLISFITNITKNRFDDNPLDIAMSAYESLIQYVEMNRSQFSGANESSNINKWGKLSNTNLPDNVAYQVVIPSTKFKRILTKDLGYEDFSVIRHSFKELGFIDADRDRCTRKRKITPNGSYIRCYVINVFDDNSPDENGKLPADE